MVSSYTMKGISSVIGAIIVEIIQGSTYTWASINTYYVSYLREHGNPSMELVDGYFIMPLSMTIGMASGMFGPTIDAVYGIKICTFFSLLFIWIAHVILYNYTALWIVYFAFGLFGVGCGMTFVPVLRNSWMYFPENKGVITGIILFGMGGSSFVFSWVADYIINPNYVQIDPQTGYFPVEISNRIDIYLFVLMITIGVLSIISFLMIFDQYKVINKEQKNQENSKTEELTATENNKKNEIKNPIFQAFKHRQLWQLIVMDFCTLYFAFLSMNTYRSFGQLCRIDESILSLLAKCCPLINGCSRFFWGLLFDLFSFKVLYFGLLIAEMTISAVFFYAGAYPYIYFSCICISAALLGGFIVVLLPLFPKIFGVKYSTQIYGIATAISGLCNFASPMIAKLIIYEFNDYKKLYLSSTCLIGISFIICCFFKETKFSYDEDDSIEKGEEMIETKV